MQRPCPQPGQCANTSGSDPRWPIGHIGATKRPSGAETSLDLRRKHALQMQARTINFDCDQARWKECFAIAPPCVMRVFGPTARLWLELLCGSGGGHVRIPFVGCYCNTSACKGEPGISRGNSSPRLPPTSNSIGLRSLHHLRHMDRPPGAGNTHTKTHKHTSKQQALTPHRRNRTYKHTNIETRKRPRNQVSHQADTYNFHGHMLKLQVHKHAQQLANTTRTQRNQTHATN